VHNRANFHTVPPPAVPDTAGSNPRRMVFLPDPAELDALADRISGHASAARERAWRLGTAAAALDWQGVAATAFRGEAHVVVAGLRGAAGRLDDAADALRKHAARLHPIIDDLKLFGIDGLHTAEDVVLNPANLLSDAGNLLSDAGSLFGDALGLFGF
jgi:hypothetical protein